MSVQQFCLRWNNHQPNFISVCSSLLHNGTLVDVTLAAEGRQLQAHKIVLSACSSYFQTLFTTNPCQHPIVILKDVQYDDLKTMVDFMYYGEVNVSQEQLPHILKTAEMLKIKGLAEMPTDPANLTKSDSKSSNEPSELMGNVNSTNQGSSTSGGGGNGSSGGIGSSNSGSVADSIWGSTESQFQQQQQQQQQQHQQHHHHHQQQQQQIQQQQQQHHHHQQQQHQQQQQQQHHHQQQNSQTQTSQQHVGLLRRTPSPLGAGASPATRRKRLRKSSNNGSGDRTSSEDQHTSALDTTGNTAGVSLSQMCQMSFGTNTGPLGNIAGHTLHTAKLLKETANADLEPHPQDSDSLEDGHGRVPMQIKPEVDISGVQQSIPLDISGATTPSEHDAPNSQSAHSDSKCTAIGRHSRAATPNPTPTAIAQTTSVAPSSQAQMGSKRNRILTRQPRVKRDSDSLSTNLISPEPTPSSSTGPSAGSSCAGATTSQLGLDFEAFATAGSSGTASTSYSSVLAHHQHHHHHHHHQLLSVPQRIERHSSEPAPSLTPNSPHLLSVPQSTPFLMKQFSDPLLPSQQAALTASASSSSSSSGATNPFAPLHRQYSHPLPGSHIASAPLQHSHHISLPESIYASGSPPPAGSSQYLVPQQTAQTSNTAIAHDNPSTTDASGANVATTTATATTLAMSSTSASLISTSKALVARLPQMTTIYVGDTSSIDCHSNSPTPPIERHSAVGSAVMPSSSAGPKLTSSKSANATLISERSSLHPHSSGGTGIGGHSSSFEHFPTLRVKSEELQRSVSSPQTTREIIFLENPRSSHCPVIRPGPALGCNFCWNTIDGHGRILRRKTKYHCPECQTNLCIVPCFQEYHERLNNETSAATAASSSSSSSNATADNATSKHTSSTTGSTTTATVSSNTARERHYTKTESF